MSERSKKLVYQLLKTHPRGSWEAVSAALKMKEKKDISPSQYEYILEYWREKTEGDKEESANKLEQSVLEIFRDDIVGDK